MKNIVIFGISKFAIQMKYYIDNDDSRNVMAFCIDDEYYKETILDGLPIIKFSELHNLYPPEDYEVLIGIGYKNMNQIREKIFCRLKDASYTVATYIHSSCLIQAEKIGEGNIILEQVLVEPFVEIGKGNLIYYRVAIAHDDKIGDFNTIAGMASIAGYVEIANNCFIGNASCIKDGISISDFTLVGAGAYVNKNTKRYDAISPTFSGKLSKKSTEYI